MHERRFDDHVFLVFANSVDCALPERKMSHLRPFRRLVDTIPVKASQLVFCRNESVSAGLRRIVDELITSAIACIRQPSTDREEDLHQVRLAIKKLRVLCEGARKPGSRSIGAISQRCWLRNLASTICPSSIDVTCPDGLYFTPSPL